MPYSRFWAALGRAVSDRWLGTESAIPISFNGWGLREGMYVVYFRQVGLPKESALAFSIVASALVGPTPLTRAPFGS